MSLELDVSMYLCFIRIAKCDNRVIMYTPYSLVPPHNQRVSSWGGGGSFHVVVCI